jgi:hypothetical protein
MNSSLICLSSGDWKNLSPSIHRKLLLSGRRLERLYSLALLNPTGQQTVQSGILIQVFEKELALWSPTLILIIGISHTKCPLYQAKSASKLCKSRVLTSRKEVTDDEGAISGLPMCTTTSLPRVQDRSIIDSTKAPISTSTIMPHGR